MKLETNSAKNHPLKLIFIKNLIEIIYFLILTSLIKYFCFENSIFLITVMAFGFSIPVSHFPKKKKQTNNMIHIFDSISKRNKKLHSLLFFLCMLFVLNPLLKPCTPPFLKSVTGQLVCLVYFSFLFKLYCWPATTWTSLLTQAIVLFVSSLISARFCLTDSDTSKIPA